MPRAFRLYPEERHWWSFNDYGAVIDVMQRLTPKRVLEFGPGSSTLALIEGGATKIDTCEDNPDWYQIYEKRLEHAYPEIVTLHPYIWSDPLMVPDITRRRYDLALIDGPLGSLQRPPVIEYALQRSASVLVPTEDHGLRNSHLRPHIARLAEQYDRTVEIFETGAHSGGFALLTRQKKIGAA